MDPSTKGLTTEITAAGLNRPPKQTPHCSLLTVFHSRLELSDGVFSRLNWFQRRTLPQQMAVEFTVRSLFMWYRNSFLLSAGRMGGWLGWGRIFPMKRPVGEWITVTPASALTHTSRHLLSLSVPFVSPLCCHSILPLHGHFTLTTGGLFVSLSGFASLGGHLRERDPGWQNEHTLEHTLSQRHIYRQVVANKPRARFTQAIMCAQTHI